VSEQARWLHAAWQCAGIALGEHRAQRGSTRADAVALCARIIAGEHVPIDELRRVTMPAAEREFLRREHHATKKPAAQLDREIAEVLHGSPTHSRKKSGGPSKKSKTVDRHKVTIWDYKTRGASRFAAYYDALPASVVGRGETAADAIADLKRTAARYGEHRQAEIEREDWAQHEADKEEALRRGDY
jgi:hypothetical protein